RPRNRPRGQDRHPQAAVGAHVLLRGEVVDIGFGDVDVEPAGPGSRVDDDESAVVAVVGRAIDVATAVEVSLCGQADTSAASAPDAAAAAEGTRPAEASAAGLGIADVPGSAASTSEDSRWGAPAVALANF